MAKQATVEIESRREGPDYLCSLSRARFVELAWTTSEFLGVVVRCLRDRGIKQKKVHDLACGRFDPNPRSVIHDQKLFAARGEQAHHPGKAVVYGAAVQGAILIGEGSLQA